MDRTGLPVERVEGELRLQRPGAAAALLTLQLDDIEAGVYAGSITLPASGRWLVDIQLKQNGKVHYHSIQELIAS